MAAEHAQLRQQQGQRWAQVQQAMASYANKAYLPTQLVLEMQVEMAQREERHQLLSKQHAASQQLVRQREAALRHR